MVYSWELKIFLLGEGLPGFLSQSPKEACLGLRSVPQKSGSGFVVSPQGCLGLRSIPRVAWVLGQSPELPGFEVSLQAAWVWGWSPGLPGLKISPQDCLGWRSDPRIAWVWGQSPGVLGFEFSPQSCLGLRSVLGRGVPVLTEVLLAFVALAEADGNRVK